MNELIDPMLSDLALFVRVADSGGFTAAAKLTRTPQPTVSRRIADLEKRLGARLFNRTTRKVVMTEAGRRVYAHAKRMLEQGEAAGATLMAMQAAPTGTLRISSTVVLGHYFLSDLTALYMARFPEVSVQMELGGRRVDLIEEGFDIALRVGRLPDSTMARIVLTHFSEGLYATQSYLDTAARLSSPDDLEQHTLLMFAQSLDPSTRRFVRGKRTKTVKLAPRYAVNEPQPILQAAFSNAGIALLPTFVGDSEVQNTRLRKVLPGWELPLVELNALTPSFKGEIPAVREFIQMAKSKFVKPSEPG